MAGQPGNHLLAVAYATTSQRVRPHGESLLSQPGVLRLTQTGAVISRLGLGGKQCTELTLLLGNEHTHHLPAYLRHADPTQLRNTVQPEQH